MIIKPLVKRYLNYDDVITHSSEIPAGLITGLRVTDGPTGGSEQSSGEAELLTRTWVKIVLM